MPNADEQDDELLVGDLVDDPVVPDAQRLPVGVAAQLLEVGIRPPRIHAERCQNPQYGQRGRLCGMVRSCRTARSPQRNAYFTRRLCPPRRSRLPPRTCYASAARPPHRRTVKSICAERPWLMPRSTYAPRSGHDLWRHDGRERLGESRDRIFVGRGPELIGDCRVQDKLTVDGPSRRGYEGSGAATQAAEFPGE